MSDTQRTKANLITLYADNTIGAITPQTMRDLIESFACSNASMYVTTPVATTIAVAGTFVKAEGATTLVGAHRGDMPANNRLRFTGTARVHIHLVANLSVKCSSNNQNVSFAIAKNGVVVDHSIMEHLITTGSDVKIMAIHADMDLDPNDYVELWVTNNTSTASVTVQRGYMFWMGMLCD
jgi:hypothetical protein